jgi:hypothetical protein
MSRRLAVALLASLALASDVGAQNQRELEAQATLLKARATAASRAVSAYRDSLTAADEMLTRVELGRIHALTTMGLRPAVVDALAIARHDLEVGLGAASYRIDAMRFVIRPSGLMHSPTRWVMVGLLANDGSEKWASQYEGADIAAGIERAAMVDIGRGTERAFRTWMFGEIPIKRMTAADWARTRLMLISDIREPAQACYAGDTGACQRGLFADPWTLRRGPMIRTGPAVNYSFPGFVIGLRASLVAQAIEMGGSGAVERLLSTPGGPAERLASAANVSLGTVVDGWAARVRDTRVGSPVISASLATTSALLMLACLGAALRSPRWR